MKRFKELTEELFNECGDYDADDMTIKELKIARNAAENILSMIEDGASVQRWQISAIVKASEELASVCASIRADQEDYDDDEWEDEEDPMYIGFEYPSMYGESTELEEAPLLGPQGSIHRAASADQSDREYAAQRAFKNAWKAKNPGKAWPGYEKAGFKSKYDFKEEADYEVDVEGLPKMYVKGNNPSEVKYSLRKVVKNPEMIRGIERVAKASLQKIFRDKASGKEEVAEETELDEADGTKRNRELFATGRITKDEFDKRMGYGKYKKKDNSKSLNGPGGVYKNLVKRIGEEAELEEAERLAFKMSTKDK